MARVFWDSNLFIYLMEKGERTDRVRSLRAAMTDRGDQLLTSSLTIGELLVKPLAVGAPHLAREYEAVIRESATVVPFDIDNARRFAEIRARRGVKVPDAIQLACAAGAAVDLFITNDERLSRVVVDGIHFITSLDRAFL